MKNSTTSRKTFNRKGAIAVLTAALIPVLVGMLSFAIDCGHLLKSRSDLQRMADAAALAAVRDLVPDPYGYQDLDAVRSRVREYSAANLTDGSGFVVLDSDIQIGRYEPTSIYSGITLLDSGILDTVRVTLRRDDAANGPVSLFFGGVLGILDSEVRATATAIVQKARYIDPGIGVLPFAIPESEWQSITQGEHWNVYGDGRISNGAGEILPGNWGTLNLGTSANSTATLSDQVLNGLQQIHLDGLYEENRIPNRDFIDSSQSFSANGDQGLSGGMKASLNAIQGETRLVPIYDTVSNQGSVLEFNVVAWAVAVVIDSNFHGSKNTYVELQKSYTYSSNLRPSSDLSNTENIIVG